MGRARDAIVSGTFPDFLRTFFRRYFAPREDAFAKKRLESKERTDDNVAGIKAPVYPKWCLDALRSVGVDLLEGEPDASVVDGSGAKWEYASSS